MKAFSAYYYLLVGLLPLVINNPNVFSVQEQASTPNIIIIFMDDMGYGDPECYGGFPYHTPRINALAAEGMRFTSY